MQFFIWLQQLGFSQWVRESTSVWAFPMFLTIHVTGMGLLVGLATVINLRLIGYLPGVPLAPLTRLFPVMWTTFYVNLVTGIVLFMSDATAKVANVAFYVKLILVAAGMITLREIRRRVFGAPGLDKTSYSSLGKTLAWSSLAIWTAAIVAARLIAYVNPRHEAWVIYDRLRSYL